MELYCNYGCSSNVVFPQLFWQLCSGVDENAVGTCAELVFAPIDASFADDAPLLPSGFRIIPLDTGVVSTLVCCNNDCLCCHQLVGVMRLY